MCNYWANHSGKLFQSVTFCPCCTQQTHGDVVNITALFFEIIKANLKSSFSEVPISSCVNMVLILMLKNYKR